MKTALIIALAIFGIACGGAPSALTSCKDYCQKQGECLRAPAADVTACKVNCDSMSGILKDLDQLFIDNCKTYQVSADEIRSEIHRCYTDYCDQSLAAGCANTAAGRCGITLQ